jgi:excisionase family DNA binding protein
LGKNRNLSFVPIFYGDALGRNPDLLFFPNETDHVLAHQDAASRVIANEDSMITPLAFSVAEACSIARTGRTSLYEAIKSGELPARKRGRRTIILADDLRQWLQSLPSIEPKPKF